MAASLAAAPACCAVTNWASPSSSSFRAGDGRRQCYALSSWVHRGCAGLSYETKNLRLSSNAARHGPGPSSRVTKRSPRRANSGTRCEVSAEEPTVDNSTILVVGGGGVGLETIKALSTAGSWVTGYQRSDKYRKDIEGLGAMLAMGDVLDPATIEKTLRSNSFDAIVCTVGGGTADAEVDKQGPINLVDAAKKAGVKRFIMISSIGAGESRKAIDDKHSSFFSNFIETFGSTKHETVSGMTFGTLEKVLKAKEIAEDYLRASGLDYTIVRPGGLLSGAPPSGKGVLTEEASLAGLISRTDVASLVLKIIFDKRTVGKTYSAIDKEKTMPPGRPIDNIEFLSLA